MKYLLLVTHILLAIIVGTIIGTLLNIATNINKIANSLETIASPPNTNTNTTILYPKWHDSESFSNGEILYPDMAHDDTLVVFNAKELNKLFNKANNTLPTPASDEEIDEVLHMYAISINQRLVDILPIKGDSSSFSAIIEITH